MTVSRNVKVGDLNKTVNNHDQYLSHIGIDYLGQNKEFCKQLVLENKQ